MTSSRNRKINVFWGAVCFCLSTSLFCAGDVINNDLKYEVSLYKNVVLEAEPVLIIMSLTNTSDVPLVIAEPLIWQGFARVQIESEEEGVIINAPRIMKNVFLPHNDYGYVLGPGESLKHAWDLYDMYPYGLPVGSYKASIIYDTEVFRMMYPRIRTLKLESEWIRFDVIEPIGEDLHIYEMFREAQDIINRNQQERFEAARTLFELICRREESVYTPVAKYRIAWLLTRMKEYRKAYQTCLDFLENHLDYPYYSDEIILIAAFSLRELVDVEEYRKIIELIKSPAIKPSYEYRLGILESLRMDMNQLQRIDRALRSYRARNNNYLPINLSILVNDGYLENKDILVSPADKNPPEINGMRISYEFIGGLSGDVLRVSTPIAYTRDGIYIDKRIILFADGTVMPVDINVISPRENKDVIYNRIMGQIGEDISEELKMRLKKYLKID